MSKVDFTSAGVLTAGNSIYRVSVQATPGLGVGLITVGTGPSHPVRGIPF